jgi:predicted ATPase
MRRLGGQSLSWYRFRHILFQRYLYHSVDPVEQAHLHQAVGTALEGLYGEGTAEIAAEAGQLARHFQEAGIAEKAVAYLHQAGERALRMSAHEEAITHFSRGLELLETLPDSGGEHHHLERAQQELPLQLGLGVSLQTIRGYAAPETGRAFGRARELCRQVGETPQLFPVLFLLALSYGTQGKLQTMHEIAQQLLSLAEQTEDPLLVAVAHWIAGWNWLFQGEFGQARTHLEHTITFYDPQQHHALAFLYGLDPGVVSLSVISWVLGALGYPDQARQRSREALALAQELSHPPSLVLAQAYAGLLHAFYRRDWQKTQEMAEACIRLATEHGFSYYLPPGFLCRGWALAEQGRVEEGIVQIRRCIDDNRATGAELGQSQGFAVLAEAYGKAGQPEEGLAAVAEALVAMSRTGERLYEVKIHRLKGELLRMQGADEAEVEACFHQAIEVARQQQAKSWELRAVMSLCRLWHSLGLQGKREEARKLLADVYNWFTEGFDTPDLQEARRLMQALS